MTNTDPPPAAHPRGLAPPTMLTCQRHASLIAGAPMHPRLHHVRRTDHFSTNPLAPAAAVVQRRPSNPAGPSPAPTTEAKGGMTSRTSAHRRSPPDRAGRLGAERPRHGGRR